MSFFSKLSKLFSRNKKAKWLEESQQQAANPKNLTPLDPNAPWNT